jgi:hypothetical protein
MLCDLFDDTAAVQSALAEVGCAARALVEHIEGECGPEAPSSEEFRRLYSVKEPGYCCQYPAGLPDYPGAKPQRWDWAWMRVGEKLYSVHDAQNTAPDLVLACIVNGIDPEDLAEALEAVAESVRRQAAHRPR